MTSPHTKIFQCLLALACLMLGGAPCFAEDSRLSIKTGVPAGFEELSAPQETIVDVYFGNLKIGGFRAVYTPKTIAFASPEEIVSKIPSLKPEAAAQVQRSLTGDLPTEVSHICGHMPAPGCGVLKPDVSGVIFYENKFRADLFVAPPLLELQDTHMDRILPPAPDIFSAVHQINGNFTSADNQQDYSLLTNSTIAYGPERLNFIGIASNHERQINTFTAGLDKWGLDNQAGLFNSHPLQLLPQISMAGISTATSLKTNLALRQATGSPLSIFLSQRSYVSLVYNNIIYATDLYEAGNQVLNTSALPEGAYEITIRVRSLGGIETEEKRFFAKNFDIPPVDQPIYFGQIGTVRDTTAGTNSAFSGMGDSLIATLGMTKSLSQTTALNTDLLLVQDKIYAEAGAFLLLPPDHRFQFSTLASSDQDFGLGGSYLGYFLNKKLSFSNNARVIFSNKHFRAGAPFEIGTPIQGDSRQWTSDLAYQVTDRANIGFAANYNDSEGTARRYAYGPRVRYDFWRSGTESLTLTAAANSTDQGLQQTVFLNFSMRLGSWGLSAQGELDKTPDSGGNSNYNKSTDMRVTWNDDQTPGRSTIIGAEKRHTDRSDSDILDLDHRGNYGNVKLIGSQTQNNGGNSNFYSGNFGFSFAHTAHEFAWGGKEQQSSGFIFKNVGNSVDVPMQVIVDNNDKAVFNTGSSSPLFLSPYQTYNVSIKPVQSSPIDYDGSTKSITLYPGNVMPLIWDINRINVVLGHVVLPDGTPLTDARLEEARNISVTDDQGLFQGELIALKTMTFHRSAEEDAPIFKNQGISDFALPPVSRSYPFPHTNMSLENQRKAILEIFDAQEENASPKTAPGTITLQHDDTLQPIIEPLNKLQAAILGMFNNKAIIPQEQAQAPVTPVEANGNLVTPLPEIAKPETARPAHTPRPALRCRVILPEVREENGVTIFKDPLVCQPIAEEEKKQEDPQKKALLHMLAPLEYAQRYTVQPLAKLRENYANAVKLYADASHKPVRNVKQTAPRELMAQAAESKVKVEAAPEIVAVEVSAPAPAAVPEEISTPAPIAAVNTVTIAEPKPAATGEKIQVQVGSYRTQASAVAALDALAEKNAKVASHIYNIIKADLGSKGIYYRLRIGNFGTKSDAKDFCKELAAGGHGCFLSMNDAR